MCGLVSVITKSKHGFNKKQVDMFGALLFVDLLRGDDSTGIFLATNKGEVSIAKDAVDSLAFIKTKEYGQIASRAMREGVALVGHNRKATVGNITDVNAHPFDVDDKIVLVHNGTLWGDHKKTLKDVEVDSHAIAHTLAEEEDVGKAINKINGAYALIWYQIQQQRLHFLRNHQRPLFWMETPDEWIWSSEVNMLVWISNRFDLRDVDSPFNKPTRPKIVGLPQDMLNTFQWTKDGWDVDTEHLNPIVSASTNSPFWDIPTNEELDAQYDDYERKKKAMQEGSAPLPVAPEPSRAGGAHNKWWGVNMLDTYESNLAKTTDRMMTYSEFYKVKDLYPENAWFKAVPFEYHFANDKDDTSGWYLYFYAERHPNLLMRQWVDSGKVSEMRLMNIACSEKAHSVKIGSDALWIGIKGCTENNVPLGKAFIRLDGYIPIPASEITNEGYAA